MSRKNRGDSTCLVLLTVFMAGGGFYAWIFDFWIQTLDISTQFLSWYGYIGERLSHGQLPAWFPYDGSGEAIIGSPASGWMYLPIMATFPFFSILTAYKLFIVIHILLSGYGMYFFARKIRLDPLPSLVAGISFCLGPIFYGAMTFQPPAAQVLIFIPLAMLAAESVLTAPRWSAVFGWSAVIGLCFSQMFIGSAPRVIYGVGFVVSWMLYRLLFTSPTSAVGSRATIIRIALSGSVSAIVAAGFVAAAALPQLAYSSQSHIPHGDYSQVVNGNYASKPWSFVQITIQMLSEPNLWRRPFLFGAGILLFAALAIIVSRNRFAVPYFAVVSWVLFDITWSGSLLRPLIVTLPGIGSLVEHRPTSSVLFLDFTLPLLAAAGIQWLVKNGSQSRSVLIRLVPLGIFMWLASWLDSQGQSIGNRQVLLAVVTTILFFLPLLSSHRWVVGRLSSLARTTAICAAVVALVIPTGIDAIETWTDPYSTRSAVAPLSINDEIDAKVKRVVALSDPGTGAEYLQNQQDILQPFRFAPWPGSDAYLYSVFRHLHDNTVAILTHTRASRLGLEQVDSYNPSHIAYYVEYLEVMNQGRQDYHTTSALSPSLTGSQLLDMLNVRYVLIPAGVEVPATITQTHRLVYQDSEVLIFENATAFLRAWIVHEVRAAGDNLDYLAELNSYAVDGRAVAFVDGALPTVTQTGPGSAPDSVIVTSYEPETIRLRASTPSDGLMVLSEVYADGWNAYVDGEKVDIVRTNHTFRGVPLTGGEHEVVLKYEPRSITVGLAITGFSGLGMLALWFWAIVDFSRNRRSIKVPQMLASQTQDDLPPSPFERFYRWFDRRWGKRWRQELRDGPRRPDVPRQPVAAPATIRLGRADIVGVLVVLAVIGWLVTTFFRDGQRLIGQDASVYYLPMWSYLGDRIGSWDIPAWNPYQNGGSPFAADPKSGWMYLPSMVFYALFSIGTATTLWLVFHFVLASLGSYFYARSIALTIPGAVMSGVAYVSSTWFYRNSVSSPAYIQTGSWIPITFLFIELAARARSLTRRLLFSGLAACTFSQIVAAWLGKGALYSLLILGSYVVYRTVIQPPCPNTSNRDRLRGLVTIGLGMGLWASLFSAAGTLPRLEYFGISNLSAGFQEYAANVGFVATNSIPSRLLGAAPDGPTTVIVFLAAIGLVLAGRRHVAVFFAVSLVAIVLLFVNEGYWLQFPLSFLPEFENIHNHSPAQILMIAMFPFAILAGIAISKITTWNRDLSRVVLAILFPFLLVWTIGFNGVMVQRPERWAVFGACALILILALYYLPLSLRTILAAGIIALHLVPFAQRVDEIGLKQAGSVMYKDVDAYYEASGAVEFIRQQQSVDGVPYRYFGYDPQYGVQVGDYNALYRRHFPVDSVVNLEVNNRATVHHLYDIQGQNTPIQIQRYVDLFTVLNDTRQDYYEASVIDTGLDSPFLDVLNVRYIIVSAEIPADRADLQYLTKIYPTVYQDDRSRVLERTGFQQRVFLAPTTTPVENNLEALSLVTTPGPTVADMAPVESDLALNSTRDPNDRATLTSYRPEEIQVETSTASNQLLVLSEIAYPGWNVYVDGKQADMQTAYGALRAVEVPAGTHSIKFVFESRPLQIGVVATAVGYGLFLLLVGYEVTGLARRRLSRNQGELR